MPSKGNWGSLQNKSVPDSLVPQTFALTDHVTLFNTTANFWIVKKPNTESILK